MAPKGKEKSKPSASQPAITIEDLLIALNRHIDRSEFDPAIKVADQGQYQHIHADLDFAVYDLLWNIFLDICKYMYFFGCSFGHCA